MMEMLSDKFINIHSHSYSNDPEVISILNLRAGESFAVEQKQLVSYGVHPWDTLLPDRVKLLGEYTMLNNLIAIGECGFDKFKAGNYQEQETLFIQHVNISEKVHKPLIIHCVGYFNEILTLKKKLNVKQTWIVHGFKGHHQLASQLVRAGIYLSFGADIIKPNNKVIKALRSLSPNSFFLETDESTVSIQEVYFRVAELLNIELILLKDHQQKLFKKCFIN